MQHRLEKSYKSFGATIGLDLQPNCTLLFLTGEWISKNRNDAEVISIVGRCVRDALKGFDRVNAGSKKNAHQVAFFGTAETESRSNRQRAALHYHVIARLPLRRLSSASEALTLLNQKYIKQLSRHFEIPNSLPTLVLHQPLVGEISLFGEYITKFLPDPDRSGLIYNNLS